MKIEILEPILHERDRFETGEIRIVDDSLGAYFCGCGWAKDLDGNVKTATRDINRVTLYGVGKSSHASSVKEI